MQVQNLDSKKITQLLKTKDEAHVRLAFQLLKSLAYHLPSKLQSIARNTPLKRKLCFELGFFEYLKENNHLHLPSNIEIFPDEMNTFIKYFFHLERLFFSHQPIHKLPNDIGKLSNLKFLDLSYTQIKELPYEIGNLQKLEVLNLWSCPLESLPPNLGQLKDLKEIHLSGSLLKNIPSSLLDLYQLEIISLNKKQLSLLSDKHFERWESLKELWITEAEIELLEPSLTNLPCLKIIKPLHLQATEDSPHIVLDPKRGIFELSGRLLPEDAGSFFQPILDWLDTFNSTIHLDFKIEYFNSGGAGRILLDILSRLAKHPRSTATWYYHIDDEDMLEAGYEYAELADVPIDFRSY